MSSARSGSHEPSAERRPTQQAVIKLEPSEPLNEILTAFLNEQALRKLGGKILPMTLLMQPYLFNDTPEHAALLSAQAKQLRQLRPPTLLVANEWRYVNNADLEHNIPATRIHIAMHLGGTAAAKALLESPLLHITQTANLIAVVNFLAADIVPEDQLREVCHEVSSALKNHPSASEQYASRFFQAENLRLVTRPINHFREVNNGRE